MIINALGIQVNQTFFWTDSTTVLKYIRNDRARFHTFVANRLAIICDGSHQDQWRYVNSNLNPADDSSRGNESERWLNGPEFLKRDESSWPVEASVVCKAGDSELEIKAHVCVSHCAENNPTRKLLQYFSSWHKIKKAVAWLLRFKNYLKGSKRDANNCSKFLTVDDINQAEKSIIQVVQKESFSEELSALKGGLKVKSNSSLYKLNPVLHDGLIRVGGRISKAPICFDAKHPIILPYKHHITEIIIQEFHERAGHQGREHVLSSLRESFWILKCNAAVRRVLSKCIKCRRYQAPVMQQKMANLPVDRITPNEPPFTNTGVDCFGPFFTKKGRSQVKRYGVIFTCLTVRAVHIEVADSLTTDSFINALRRFVARRGQVKMLRCDRGTNFVGAERELREAMSEWNESRIHETLLKKGIVWQFNPPHASHFGGAWERQIRTVRKVLNATMNEQTLTDDSLTTLMCEIEAVINSRPLTTVSSDDQDLMPLTPNHLLTLRDSSIAVGKFEPSDMYSKRRWRHVQYLADLFWKRWKKEYLSGLQQRQKWNETRYNLSENDIVLVVDDNSPWSHWLLGRILKVHVSDDGLVRSATVQCGKSALCRPLAKLVLLCEN
ncbi:hypothetical protein Pcinc_009834 [Petrolisthes cinctipes]|nr:hypothetical protein Pcinc_009834 [Petrolisthes cinctipes]